MKTQQPQITSQSIRRLQAGELILREYDVEEIAEITDSSPSSVYRWRKTLHENNNNLIALRRKPNSGRPPRLSAEQMEQLKTILQKNATEHGYDANRWTSQVVSDMIAKIFNVILKPRAVRYVLNKLKLSYQKPDVKDIRQSQDELDQWIKSDWPRLKKSEKTGLADCFSR